MSTITQTYTRTDIRKVFEMFLADLLMLASRTQAIEPKRANEYAYDISQMALANCLSSVHVHLYDVYGNLVRAYQYSIQIGILPNSQRPGGNRWPCLPDGSLHVIVTYSDTHKAEMLKKSGKLKIDWRPTDLSTDYSRMRNTGNRFYSSNDYGLRRDAFVN